MCMHACVCLTFSLPWPYFCIYLGRDCDQVLTRRSSKVRQGHTKGERSWKWMKSGRFGVKGGKCWVNKRHQIALCRRECLQTWVPSIHRVLTINTVQAWAMYSAQIVKIDRSLLQFINPETVDKMSPCLIKTNIISFPFMRLTVCVCCIYLSHTDCRFSSYFYCLKWTQIKPYFFFLKNKNNEAYQINSKPNMHLSILRLKSLSRIFWRTTL